MSVDETHIDEQHQRLLAQVNKIIDTMILGGVNSKEVSEAIGFFDRYIKEHFSYEEDYMEKHHYPEIEAHKEKHHGFADKYLAFKEKVNGGAKLNDLIMEIENYLGQWWVEHIGKEDKKYHDFIASMEK